ncbi:MAG: nuclear transport factor 2 family protein [Candidatus Korobacteraceae bacterium]|jgi:uncharacterized protein (TIGR02246 family)
MKSMRLIASALFAVCLLVPALAWGQGGNPPASTKESGATSGHGMTAAEQTYKGKGGDVEQQISALSDQVIQAQLKDDTSFFEKYYADDAAIIHSDGTVWTKAQEIANLKSGTLKYESIDARERKIRVYGDTAIVTFLISFKGVVTGKPYSGDIRRTQVWVKQKGNWKTVAYQVTRVAPASQ